MKVRILSSLDDADVNALIENIPYFTELKLNDYEQYKLLIAHSKIMILHQGEILLSKGELGNEVYFLARGRLNVFSGVDPSDKALNQLATGEIIGALSIINHQPRTATLAASTSNTAEKTIVIATDFSIFGDLHDFTNVKLQTKINFLHLVINNIRYKISTYQKLYPKHRLASKNHNVGPFIGEIGTEEELDNLSGQAFVLTLLLDNWNKETESSIQVPKVELKERRIGKLRRFFK